MVDSRVVIVCQTSEPFSVNWEHTPVGDKFPKAVFLASAVIPPYDQRMKVEVNRETGEYQLIIHSVQTTDAGQYACIDEAGQGDRQVAELAVLGASSIFSPMRLIFCSEIGDDAKYLDGHRS